MVAEKDRRCGNCFHFRRTSRSALAGQCIESSPQVIVLSRPRVGAVGPALMEQYIDSAWPPVLSTTLHCHRWVEAGEVAIEVEPELGLEQRERLDA